MIVFPSYANAVRIKDITNIEGVRENHLVGYGLVVGLDGTGDGRRSDFTLQSMSSMLDKMGINIDSDDIDVDKDEIEEDSEKESIFELLLLLLLTDIIGHSSLILLSICDVLYSFNEKGLSVYPFK